MVNTPQTTKRPAPVAKRIIELSLQLKGCRRLSPALTKELNELARDTLAYLRDRSASVRALSAGADAKRIEKTEAEILALESKGNKTEEDYARLSTLERMLNGLRKEGESATAKADHADALLMKEIQGFRQPLISALSINSTGDVQAKAAKAIEPFLLGRDPDQFIHNLPAVLAANVPFQGCMRAGIYDKGVTAADEICALIEKVLAGEI